MRIKGPKDNTKTAMTAFARERNLTGCIWPKEEKQKLRRR